MRQSVHKILVTGGAGFIGSEFVRQDCKKKQSLIVVDNLSYAGDLERLKSVQGKFKFYKTDITHNGQIEHIFKKERPHTVVHFAAETHVDRSILDATPFINTNVTGTQNMISRLRCPIKCFRNRQRSGKNTRNGEDATTVEFLAPSGPLRRGRH